MIRFSLVFLLFLLAFFRPADPLWAAPGSSSPPMTYELMINGESFLVQADRQQELKSRQTPGVTYDIALRIAMEQRVELNTLAFHYDWPADVQDDHRRPQRTVRIRHELGYTMLITDLGQPMPPEERDQALKVLWESVVDGFKESHMEAIEMAKPHSHQFSAAAGQGVVIYYRDSQGFDQTCLLYLLVGEKFSASCVVQYFDRDADAVLPRIRKTLESIKAIP